MSSGVQSARANGWLRRPIAAHTIMAINGTRNKTTADHGGSTTVGFCGSGIVKSLAAIAAFPERTRAPGKAWTKNQPTVRFGGLWSRGAGSRAAPPPAWGRWCPMRSLWPAESLDSESLGSLAGRAKTERTESG